MCCSRSGCKVARSEDSMKAVKEIPVGQTQGWNHIPPGFVGTVYINIFSAGAAAQKRLTAKAVKSVPSRRNIIKYQSGDNKKKGDMRACSRTFFNVPFTVHTGGRDTPTPCRLTRRHSIRIGDQHNNNSQFRSMLLYQYRFVRLILLSPSKHANV